MAISIDDVQTALGVVIEESQKEQVEAYIGQAEDAFLSEAFGNLTNYGFGSGTVTHRLKAYRQLVLPYKVVQRVILVKDHRGEPVEFEWNAWQPQTIHKLPSANMWFDVTYDWQLERPKAIDKCIAEMVARVLRIPDDVRAGSQQTTETTGPFSGTESWATWAVGGQVMLSPEDKRLAARFKPAKTLHSWCME